MAAFAFAESPRRRFRYRYYYYAITYFHAIYAITPYHCHRFTTIVTPCRRRRH